MYKLTPFSFGALSKTVGALVLAATFLGGCASTLSLAERAEVQSRRPPEVTLGPELELLKEPVKPSDRDPLVLLTSLVGEGGRAHVFVTDNKKQLHHIEVLADSVVKAELVGMIDLGSFYELRQAKDVAFDAVEQPGGRLRVLAGDKQFIRRAPDSGWQEVKGNRCQRFLPVKNDLYCAFVAKGEELEAPQRTDYTVGWFLLVPWISWSTKQAQKLVIAQESVTDGSDSSWRIRAVVDPDTPEDAGRNFLAGIDDQGTLHFLYFAAPGGKWFYIGPVAPAAIILPMGGPTTRSELRYAHVTLDRQPPNESESQDPDTEKASKRWLSAQGASLQWPKATERDNLISDCVQGTVNAPFGTNFIIAPATVSVQGPSTHLASPKTSADITVVCRYARATGLIGIETHLWEVQIRDGHVLPHLNIVAAEGLPDSTYDWVLSFVNPIKQDNRGNFHALLAHLRFIRFSSSTLFVDYVIKSGGNWSAPLTLGALSGSRTLAVADTGEVFAAWLNTEGKFVGRWVRPSQ